MVYGEARSFRLGLLVNPYAGVGGAIANKGSDDLDIQAMSKSGPLKLVAPARVQTFFKHLISNIQSVDITLVTVKGPMGADYISDFVTAHELSSQSISTEFISFVPPAHTGAQDTAEATKQIVKQSVDLLVFVGGDGTARDVCHALQCSKGLSQVVLGIPSGVKMHSGVFAVNPQMAGDVVSMLINGELVSVQQQEVRDIDEDAFRRGLVKSCFYGEMLVPEEGRFLQNVKQGGLEVEELVIMDMADQLQEQFNDSVEANTLIIMGPGSTTLGIQRSWGLEGTLLGVDLIVNGSLLVRDADEQSILQVLDKHDGGVALVITAIGGQGHIIGRGNQQISSRILRQVGRDNVHVVATKTKLKTLNGRPFMIDSGDESLDTQWCGYLPVITGFNDKILYAVGYSIHGG